MKTVGKKRPDIREREGEQEFEMSKEEEQAVYQVALSTEWTEGLMQRIQQSLISNTPLIMCEKDLNALDFLVLAANCAVPKTILIRIDEIKEETKKLKRKEK